MNFIFKDFFSFLIKPERNNVKITLSQKIIIFLFLYILLILKIFALIKIGEPNVHFKNPNLFNTFNTKIIWAVFIAPVVEEIVYRLPLKFSINSFFFTLSYLIFFYCTKIFSFAFETYYTYIFNYLIILMLFFVFKFIFRNRKIKIGLYLFWKKYFVIIFYSLSFLFAFSHIFNYDSNFLDILKAAHIIILPRFISAIIFGYIRLRINLFGSVLMHSMINAVPFVILFL
jgi:hypothetical protein